MPETPISIIALSSISALGDSPKAVWESYLNNAHFFNDKKIGEERAWVSLLTDEVKERITGIRTSFDYYKDLDESVLYAIEASRNVIKMAEWEASGDYGINIGSSRGATSLFEKYHSEFLESKRVPTLSSPTTTLGNISSWVASDLGSSGPELSHSITCSSALHAFLNGIAWIRGGMAQKFMVGGSEAPLTPFTIAQMRALKIYSREKNQYPCRALDFSKKKNTMVLGEGAAMACLEPGRSKKAKALVAGIGYATEPLVHPVSISAEALCFQRSMKMALGSMSPDEVDAIVMHSPGTVKGDLAEKMAVEKIFCNKLPLLTTNKWKVGHTFGASGMLSVEMALLMLEHQQFISVPFTTQNKAPNYLNNIMVNAVGFGGNAVSILLSRPDF